MGAAPDLLEACLAYLRYYYEGGGDSEHGHAIGDMEAAVRKAGIDKL